MGLGSGAKAIASKKRAISSDVIDALNKAVGQFSDGNLDEPECKVVATEIDSIYNNHNGQPIRKIKFHIDDTKKLVAEVTFVSVDILPDKHVSNDSFSF
jgi:hypothetical protein